MAAALKSKDELKQRRVDDVVSESKDRRKGLAGIDKKSVTVHKAVTTKDDSTDVTGSTIAGSSGTPTDEQLTRINEFTLSPKTADELYVLNTMSANTLPDRDDDFFPKATIEEFAALPQPFSPIGKSYLVGHNHQSLGVGRIFGADTAKAESATFLTNEVYIPRTAQFEPFIESVDFGLNWAVSVGVLLNEQLCSICKAAQYGGWFFGGLCDNGHWKSAYYDPKETETDSWGYIIEANPDDPKAVKCLGIMNGAKDFYELSQVFLGAQYFAEVRDQSKGVVKSVAKAKGFSTHIPIIGLAAQEAEELALPHTDNKVVDALQRFDVTRNGEELKWTDENELVWNYTPGEKVLCLGKSGDTVDQKEAEDAASTTSGEVPDVQSEAGSAGEERPADAVPEPVSDRSGDQGGGASDSGSDDGDPNEVGTDGDLSDAGAVAAGATIHDGAKVLAAAKSAGFDEAWVKSVLQNKSDPVAAVIKALGDRVQSLESIKAELEPRAQMGSDYLSALKSNCIAAYVKAKGVGTQRGVDTAHVEKLLDRFGEDVEMIKDLTTEYEAQLHAKLPRRSTVDPDPNERQSVKTLEQDPQGAFRPSGRTRHLSTVGEIHR